MRYINLHLHYITLHLSSPAVGISVSIRHVLNVLLAMHSGVWRKDATELTSLKYLRWLKVSLFEFSTTKHLRGHELKLNKHRSKLEVRRHFFTEQLVNRWNSLDHHTVNASTVNSFKNGLQRLKQSRMGFFED